MKQYVIIISEKFPKTHSRAGENTGFLMKIKGYEKIHTIRKNYDLWEKRIKEVQEGKACISIRKWSGLPYRSQQVEIFKYDKSHGVGIEKLQLGVNGLYIDNVLYPHYTSMIKHIALNDGLSFDCFKEWFKSVTVEDELAIIHFTDFRYNS